MYRIPKYQIPCRFAQHFTDFVPMPFGSGSCSMPSFECGYDGDKIIPDDLVCKENAECPAYEPVATKICAKHNKEYPYNEECPDCMREDDERYRRQDEHEN